MNEQKAIITFKNGDKITLDNPADISKYSSREDLESISFFENKKSITKKEHKMEEKIVKEEPVLQQDAGVLEIDAGMPQVQTIATVSVPSIPVKLPEKPPASMAEVLPLLTGAIAGAVSSMGMPALTNLVKNLLKQKLGKGGEGKQEEPDEPTDCKTHQIKANAKFVSLSSRLTKLESKLGLKLDSEGGEQELDFDLEDIKDLSDKVEKLETAISLLKLKEKVEKKPSTRKKKNENN